MKSKREHGNLNIRDSNVLVITLDIIRTFLDSTYVRSTLGWSQGDYCDILNNSEYFTIEAIKTNLQKLYAVFSKNFVCNKKREKRKFFKPYTDFLKENVILVKNLSYVQMYYFETIDFHRNISGNVNYVKESNG